MSIKALRTLRPGALVALAFLAAACSGTPQPPSSPPASVGPTGSGGSRSGPPVAVRISGSGSALRASTFTAPCSGTARATLSFSFSGLVVPFDETTGTVPLGEHTIPLVASGHASCPGGVGAAVANTCGGTRAPVTFTLYLGDPTVLRSVTDCPSNPGIGAIWIADSISSPGRLSCRPPPPTKPGNPFAGPSALPTSLPSGVPVPRISVPPPPRLGGAQCSIKAGSTLTVSGTQVTGLCFGPIVCDDSGRLNLTIRFLSTKAPPSPSPSAT